MLAFSCKHEIKPSKTVPRVFCWTKMGTEAGQTLEQIVKRKELERLAGEGVFAWGIGNSLGGSYRAALGEMGNQKLDVLFTPMKSQPKQIDVAPPKTVVWTTYIGSDGVEKELPPHIVITSRSSDKKKSHYALLCHSRDSLTGMAERISFSKDDVCNYVSGNQVGASQVTSMVKLASNQEPGAGDYQVAFRAKFFEEGFIKLAGAVEVDARLKSLCQKSQKAEDPLEWIELALHIRSYARARKRNLVDSNFNYKQLSLV